MAASCSFSFNHQQEKYEVFISFSGDDVRTTFLSHLLAALQRNKIRTFSDNYLQRGRNISESLFQTIEDTMISVVIFSENYAKSEWCLEELEKIHQRLNLRKQKVVPVFYRVDPSHVQNLQHNFAVEVPKWRDALVHVSNISGFDSKNSANEAELVDEIVNAISKELSDIYPSHDSNDQFIYSHIKDVESLLHFELARDVRMVGIGGMGGIGKTTIATKVFERNMKKFEGYSFISNVREACTNSELKNLRDKIFSDLLGENEKIDSFRLLDRIRRRLHAKKVLIVLDDVGTCTQLKFLVQDSGLVSPNTLGPGSRIIVTSRDQKVLGDMNMKKEIYKAKQLEDSEALRLFCTHVFGQEDPPERYTELSNKVVRYAQGVPLALVVLGSKLKNESTTHWEESLTRFNNITPSEIIEVLRVSFDGLEWDERDIFLDIACFFKGCYRPYVERVLKAFDFQSSIGIDSLIRKSLIIEEKGRITMNDLHRRMGQEIVVNGKQCEQQCRLWKIKDIKDALGNEEGTRKVQAISSVQYGKVLDDIIFIHPNAFTPKCQRLRFLQIDINLGQGPTELGFLPSNIRYLDWHSYPLKFLPSDYNPEKLVELHLFDSQLTELVFTKHSENLKCIDLRRSKYLNSISDLAKAPSLEVLDLRGCSSLVEIGSSIENLNKLTRLDLRGCSSLSYISEIPLSIKKLHLKGSGLRELPSRISHLTHLRELCLCSCEKLEFLSSSICHLISLERLNLSKCRTLKTLPEDLGKLRSLKELDASKSGLRELPHSIHRLKKLVRLKLVGCEDLKSLPVLPSNLEVLHAQSCTSLEIVRTESIFPKRTFDVSGCHKLLQMAASIMEFYLRAAQNLSTKMPNFCIPGTEVPEGMKYSNKSGSILSLDIDTPAHHHIKRFIFCVVMPFNPCFEGGSFRNAFPEVILTRKSGQSHCHFNRDYFSEVGSLKEAPHVLLWNRIVDHRESELDQCWLPSTHERIIGWGVHPIYLRTKNRKRKHGAA